MMMPSALYRRAIAAEVACDNAATWLDSEPLRDAARVIAALRALVPAARLHAPPDAAAPGTGHAASAPVRDEQDASALADGSDTAREGPR